MFGRVALSRTLLCGFDRQMASAKTRLRLKRLRIEVAVRLEQRGMGVVGALPMVCGWPYFGSLPLQDNVDVGLSTAPPPQGQQGLRLKVLEDHIPLIKVTK